MDRCESLTLIDSTVWPEFEAWLNEPARVIEPMLRLRDAAPFE